MALTITDPGLIALIERRSRESGLPVEEVIALALQADGITLRATDASVAPSTPPDSSRDEADEARHHRIVALIDRIGATMDPSLSREAIDELLYDEHGLPR
ncbi:MAG: type II toxin-antitoxin system VapB family antitoxin [Thermomicrobiales bacterium]